MYVSYAITSDGKKSPIVSSINYINDFHASKYALKSAFVYNLFDNSYFVNPVNQRGQSSYTEANYTIDRWTLKEGAGTNTISGTTTNLTKYQNFDVYVPSGSWIDILADL